MDPKNEKRTVEEDELDVLSEHVNFTIQLLDLFVLEGFTEVWFVNPETNQKRRLAVSKI